MGALRGSLCVGPDVGVRGAANRNEAAPAPRRRAAGNDQRWCLVTALPRGIVGTVSAAG